MNHADPHDRFGRTFAERLGGRWLVSWPTFIIGGLFSSLVLFPDIITANRTNDQYEMLAWWLLALIATASISYMEHRTVLRHRATKPVSIWLASILIVANNTVFTSIYVRGLHATQLTSNNLFVNEVATTVVLGVWLSIFIITLADTWESWRTTRNQLIEQKIQMILLTQSQIDLSNAIEQNKRSELQDLMQKSKDDLAASIGDHDTESLIQHTKQILDAVEHLSQQVVQPFSQSLWTVTSETYPKVKIRSLIGLGTEGQLFNTFWLTSAIFVSVVADYIEQLGGIEGLSFLLIGTAVIATVSQTANWATRQLDRWRKQIFAVAMAAFVIIQLVSNSLFENFGGNEIEQSYFFIQIMGLALLVLVTSNMTKWKLNHEMVSKSFELQIDNDQAAAVALSHQTAQKLRDVARLFHGAVQTRLTTSILMIKQAQQNGDDVALNLALLEAVSVLQTPLPNNEIASTLGLEIERKVSLWQGISTIDVQIEPQLSESSDVRIREISRLVEEGISNAVRHGGATLLQLTVSLTPNGSVTVQLDDNGSGPGTGKPSIGSAIFTQTTQGNWSLSATPNGSRLVAIIPVPTERSR